MPSALTVAAAAGHRHRAGADRTRRLPLPRRSRAMQAIEVGAALLVGADNLSVDHGRDLNPRRLLDDPRISLRPVRPVDRVEPHTSCPPGVYLQPAAVVLDLVHPAITAWRLLGNGGTAGMNEAQRHAPKSALGITGTPQHETARKPRFGLNRGANFTAPPYRFV
jgi:hypothetical protein